MKGRVNRIILALAVLLTAWEMILSSLVPLSPHLHVWIDHHGQAGLEAHSHWHGNPATRQRETEGIQKKERRVRGVTWHDSTSPSHPDEPSHSHSHGSQSSEDSPSDHHHKTLSQVFASGALHPPGSSDINFACLAPPETNQPGIVLLASARLILILLAPRPPPHFA